MKTKTTVRITTDYYKYVHGHAPRGEGCWLFSTEQEAEVGMAFQARGTFTEAKKAAIAHYREIETVSGYLTVFVLS